jgi:hypothetical protein
LVLASSGNFGIDVVLSRAVTGGFFLRKKPLEYEVSVYSNSKIATALRK